VSIGVAACDPCRETQASLLERTDIALYQAKRLGRNRAYTAPDWAA
jgi:PleD family two-component response regulator